MNDFLCHHGILGQKWGVRRYQNKDGSLTSDGKRRYSRKEINADYSKTWKKEYDQSKAEGHDIEESLSLANIRADKAMIKKYGAKRMDEVKYTNSLVENGKAVMSIALPGLIGTVAFTAAFAAITRAGSQNK